MPLVEHYSLDTNFVGVGLQSNNTPTTGTLSPSGIANHLEIIDSCMCATVNQTDPDTYGGKRSEITFAEHNNTGPYAYKFKLKVNSADWGGYKKAMSVFQIHNSPGPMPNFVLFLENDQLVGIDGMKWPLNRCFFSKFKYDVWNEIALVCNWQFGTGGFIEIWINGIKEWSSYNKATQKYTVTGNYAKLGIYDFMGNGDFGTKKAYYSDVYYYSGSESYGTIVGRIKNKNLLINHTDFSNQVETNISPTKIFNFLETNTLPSELTYSRSDAYSTIRNSDGYLVGVASETPLFDHDENGNPIGLMIEGARVNRFDGDNANPTTISGSTTTGTATASLVTDSTALQTAKLNLLCTGNVIEVNGGSSGGTFVIQGTTGSTSNCSFSCYARILSGSTATLTHSGTTPGTTTISGSVYNRFKLENQTINATDVQMVISVSANTIVRFILPQIEIGACASSVKHTTVSGQTTSAAKLRDTKFNIRPYFNMNEGAIAVELVFDNDEQTLGSAAYPFIIGTEWVDTLGIYTATPTRSKFQSRAYTRASSIINNDLPSGFIKNKITRVGVIWKNGKYIIAFGDGYGHTLVQAPLPMYAFNFSLFDIGQRNGSTSVFGHIRKIIVYNKAPTLEDIGRYFYSTNENIIMCGGQSNMFGHFGNQTGSGNAGQRAMVTEMDKWWDGLNIASNGAWNGSRVIKGASNSAGWWYDSTNNVFGDAYLQWERTAKANLSTGTIKAILWDQGESDVGSVKATYQSALLAVFNKMRSVVGNVPVVIIPIGRREDDASSDAQFQTMRENQRELARDYSWIDCSIEKTSQPIGDSVVHVSNSGCGAISPIIIRRAAQLIGETVTTGTVGPKIISVNRSDTTVTVTLSHDVGGTDISPVSGISGFRFKDGSSWITVTNAVRTNATTITLTLASTPSNSSQILYYLYGTMYAEKASYTSFVVDNNSLPLQAAEFISFNTGNSFSSAW